MPRIEDLPIPAQAQIAAAQRSETPAAPPAGDKKRMTLLQRLAAVGLGRRDDEAEDSPPVQAKPADTRMVPAQRPAPSADVARRAPAPIATPNYRPAAGQLDQHGRAPTPARAFEDDQLEIPAFLRRHSN